MNKDVYIYGLSLFILGIFLVLFVFIRSDEREKCVGFVGDEYILRINNIDDEISIKLNKKEIINYIDKMDTFFVDVDPNYVSDYKSLLHRDSCQRSMVVYKIKNLKPGKNYLEYEVVNGGSGGYTYSIELLIDNVSVYKRLCGLKNKNRGFRSTTHDYGEEISGQGCCNNDQRRKTVFREKLLFYY